MSRVFIVQRTLRRDRATGKLVERFGIDKAAEFGELVDLLGPNAAPFHPDPILKELHEKLWSFGKDDYLLCIGSPVLIGWAFAIAADYNDGVVSCLQWSGTSERYIPIVADVYRHTFNRESAKKLTVPPVLNK